MAKYYIDRAGLVEWLKRIPLVDLSDGRGLCRVIFEDDFKKAIKKMPKGIVSDVAPIRHAHWEYWDGWMSNHDMRIECACSACGYKDVVRGYGYDNIKHLPERCHGCWAKMDEEVSE